MILLILKSICIAIYFIATAEMSRASDSDYLKYIAMWTAFGGTIILFIWCVILNGAVL